MGGLGHLCTQISILGLAKLPRPSLQSLLLAAVGLSFVKAVIEGLALKVAETLGGWQSCEHSGSDMLSLASFCYSGQEVSHLMYTYISPWGHPVLINRFLTFFKVYF